MTCLQFFENRLEIVMAIGGNSLYLVSYYVAISAFRFLLL